VQVACLYHWKYFDEGYNFALDLTSIEGLHKKLWPFKVLKIPILGILRFPTWESWEKMTFGCSLCATHREYYKRGRRWFPPSLGYGEFCESMCARDLFMHQKCSNYALFNLLFGSYRSMWIIDSFVIYPSSHPGAPAHPSTPKVLQTKERILIPNNNH